MVWYRRPGFVLIIFLIALGQAALYGFLLTPPWQAPDEPGHYEYVRAVSDYGLRRPTVSEREALQREIIESLAAESFWKRIGRVQPDPQPQVFVQDPYLNGQIEDEPPLYYLLPALLLQWGQTVTDQLYLIRAWSILLYLVTIVFVYLGLKELIPDDGLVPAVGALLGVSIPMPAFIGSSCNNDAAAMAISAVAIWLLLRHTRRGWSAGSLIGLLAVLATASLCKKTTTFLWLLAGVTLTIGHWEQVKGWISRHRRAAPALTLLLVSVTTVAWTWHTNGASGWIQPADQQVARRNTQTVYSGSHALELKSLAGVEPARILQELSHNKAAQHRGQTLTMTAWLAAGDGIGTGYLVIYDGQSSSREPITLRTDEWQQATVTHRVSRDADRLGVVLANSGENTLCFDSISLVNESDNDLLVNGGGEIAAHWAEGWVARWLSDSPGLKPHLLEPASYSIESIKRYLLYAGLSFAGFWANFGWLTVPLAAYWYLIPAIMCAGALIGLLRARANRRTGGEPRETRHLVVLISALVLIGLQTFIPMIGSAWQPQGRYLFPALLPIVALLTMGWLDLFPARVRLASIALLLVSSLAFGQLCVWGYVVPRYWG